MQMKKIMRVGCLILALLMTFLFCACDGGTGNDGTTGSGTESQATSGSSTTGTTTASETTTVTESSGEDGGEEVPAPLEIPVEMLANMNIVYPSSLFAGGSRNSGTLWDAIVALQASILRYYEVEVGMVNDRSRETEYEILIGDVDRDECAQTTIGKGQKDYGYEIVGTKILINGGSYTYMQRAVSLFNSSVVSAKAAGVGRFFHEGLNRAVTSRYAADGVLINDLPITSFNVVYPANATDAEKYLANGIVDRFATLTGLKPKVYTDATAYEDGTYEILIGRTNREFSITTTTGAAIEAGGNFLALVGENSYDLGLAKQYLLKLVEAAPSLPSKKITLPAVRAVEDRETVSMMAYNIYGVNGMVYQERADNFCLLINKYLPDIVTFQEPAKNLMDLTYTNLDQYYEYYLGEPRHTASNSVNAVPIVDGTGAYKMEGGNIKMGNGSGGANSYAPILFAKNRFELVEGDSKWFTTRPDVLSKFDNLSDGAAYEKQQYCRMYTYVLLRDLETDQEFLVVNIHLDFNDALTKMEVQCMLKQLQEDGYNEYPVFLLGDFNSNQSSSVMQMLLGTNGAGFKNVFNMGASVMQNGHGSGTIDWIITMPDCVSAIRYNNCNEKYEDITADKAGKTYSGSPVHNNMPSDHPAIFAEVQITGNPSTPYDWSNVTGGITLTRDP